MQCLLYNYMHFQILGMICYGEYRDTSATFQIDYEKTR